MSKTTSRIGVKSKIWLEVDGRPAFGDGKCHWMTLIEETGSLKAAAEKLDMSYRGLWGRLRETERRLGVLLVERHAGGRGGGGTRLTDQGRRFLSAYKRFRSGINEYVDRRSAKLLAQMRAMLEDSSA
jgi:molybdate transport system regulatory protein